MRALGTIRSRGAEQMARPKRETEWAPITARLSLDAARRLRVAAARMDLTQGRVLDQLIMDHLPPATPLPRPKAKATATAQAEPQPVTIEWLRRQMERTGKTQSDLAREVGITPKSVSEWFDRGKVPVQRWPTLRRILGRASRS